MKRWMHLTFIAIGTLAVIGAATVAVASRHGETKKARVLDLPAHPVALRDDASAIARGKYLFESRGCTDCHGLDGAGRTFVDDGKGLRLAGPNISPGPGSVVAHYTPADWEHSIRHGVKPDGTPLMVMPAEDYNRLTDDDLSALVAWLRHMPPAAGGAAVIEFPLPLRAMYGLGLIQDAAEKIDHRLPPQQAVAEGVTREHGQYVAAMCQGCHGAGLAGGKIPGTPPDWPAAANLTPGEGSAMPRYASADQFTAMLRTGKRPDGSAVSRVMPFEALGRLNDTDAQALYLYLQGVPAKAAGTR
jgi:mono/diheme cytochrome c family protein